MIVGSLPSLLPLPLPSPYSLLYLCLIIFLCSFFRLCSKLHENSSRNFLLGNKWKSKKTWSFLTVQQLYHAMSELSESKLQLVICVLCDVISLLFVCEEESILIFSSIIFCTIVNFMCTNYVLWLMNGSVYSCAKCFRSCACNVCPCAWTLYMHIYM